MRFESPHGRVDNRPGEQLMASMDLSRQEYPALLRSLSPNQAVTVLDDRVRLIGKINIDIADWLAERRRVEENYVQGLQKLAGRGPRDASSELGIFRTPWQNITSSMESLAQSHSTLAQRIEADVERPLKEYQTRSREMQAINTIQGNLNAVAKEFDNAQKKAAKLSGGKSTGTKIASATSDVEAVNQQWESQAPYVFEQLQALDESRVNHLRDVLTQLETNEVDQVERNRTSAEACLNAILNINTAEEISAFVARQTANAPVIPERTGSRNRTGSSASASTPFSDPPPTLAATKSRRQETSFTASPYSTTSSKMAPPVPVKKGFGGLRRLGTVLSRDRGSKGVDRPPSLEKRSRPGRNPLRRGQSSRQNMQQIDDSSPPTSSANLPSQAPQLDNPIERSSSPIQPQQSTSEPTSNNIPTPTRNSSLPVTNGIQSGRQPPPVQEMQTESQSPQPVQGERDAEGYSVPSSAVDDITRAQQEAAFAGDTDPSQFKLNIRNAPIREEDPVAQQSAFTTVASTLRSQAVAPRKPSGNRGRRDVRNTVFVPSGQSPESAGLGNTAGLPSLGGQSLGVSNTPPVSSEGFRGSDAQSIRSAHSMSSTANTAITHPHTSRPGLNASIVETVSATFSNGQVTKAIVIGELALQHNTVDGTFAPSSETVRLENFPVLEKVAPNPTFVTQTTSVSGEYSVNLAQTTRPTIAFKYQVHLDDSSLAAHAPITLTPSWKTEPSQASVILSYAFNPSFVSPAKRSVALRNVIIFIGVEGVRASSCQSKPAGIFSKEKSLIYWKLGDVTLDGYAEAPQKLLARFSTEGEAKPGSVDVRWEIADDATTGLGSGLAISQDGSGAREESGGSDPFADESTGTAAPASAGWRNVPLTRRIISGKYTAA